MATDDFRFSPSVMHEDARRFVADRLGRPVTRAEVSSWFTRMTLDEVLREPAASAAFYAQKLRWFFSPVEVPSSASLAIDRSFSPLLRVAFVPTWIVAALAVVGAWVHRRRREVLLGPGALVLAHLVVLTLVFPLSHYRSPAVPAMAVLASGAVAWGAGAWREGRRRALAVAAAGAAAVALAGALPPQPDPLRHNDALLLAFRYRDLGQWDRAAAQVRAAQTAFASEHPALPEEPEPWFLLAEIESRRDAWDEAIRHLTTGLALEPSNWPMRLSRSLAYERTGRLDSAREDAARVVAAYPELGDAQARLGEVLVKMGRIEEARAHLSEALRAGSRPDEAAMRRAGLLR
jgi:MYXO-CTERM domain-containing protein